MSGMSKDTRPEPVGGAVPPIPIAHEPRISVPNTACILTRHHPFAAAVPMEGLVRVSTVVMLPATQMNIRQRVAHMAIIGSVINRITSGIKVGRVRVVIRVIRTARTMRVPA